MPRVPHGGCGLCSWPGSRPVESSVFDPYPQSGRRGNELATWEAIGLFTTSLSAPVAELPSLVDPANTHAGITFRVRSYLHANCAGCHRPDGPTRTDLDFRYWVAPTGMNACNVPPAADDLGVAGAMPIVKKKPDKSLVYLRMNRRDLYQMPPLGTTLVDTANVALIKKWINRGDVCTDVADSDGDGVPNNSDNCLEKFNPDQSDGDADRWGNRCDGDFNATKMADYADRNALIKRLGAVFDVTTKGKPRWHPRFDLNGDGVIDETDLDIFDTELFGNKPGPSGIRSK